MSTFVWLLFLFFLIQPSVTQVAGVENPTGRIPGSGFGFEVVIGLGFIIALRPKTRLSNGGYQVGFWGQPNTY